jgi:hypothetical protein
MEEETQNLTCPAADVIGSGGRDRQQLVEDVQIVQLLMEIVPALCIRYIHLWVYRVWTWALEGSRLIN